MKRSEVMKELLASYNFQHGKSVNYKVCNKAIKIMNQFKKEEEGIKFERCERETIYTILPQEEED